MLYLSKSDLNGYLYCARLDKVESGAFVPCSTCEYFRGSLQGEGRECEIGEDDKVIDIQDPYAYMNSKGVNEDNEEG